jgi:hypothetical protein
MNERIRQLAELAETKEIGYYFFDREKFAELIVRECMRMCEVTEMSFVTHDCDVEASGAITVKQFIAEHFGVEE